MKKNLKGFELLDTVRLSYRLYDAWCMIMCCYTGQIFGPEGYPERTESFKDIHVYHTKTKKWSLLNQERELKMEDLPYIMCYRIPAGKGKVAKNFPPPRVDHF